MKLLIIRHGDPDYEHDALTPQGEREAVLLAEEFVRAGTVIQAAYVSPLGRAKRTASHVLNALGMTAEECAWLREFDPCIRRPDKEGFSIAWDWLPQDWTPADEFLSVETWLNHPVMSDSDAPQKYWEVCSALDALLNRHGYRRDGRLYRAHHPNTDTIALFCHFGVESVILSHMLNISPVLLWHGFCALPTSVTTVCTEERREGIASFRVLEYGSVTHLTRAGVEPSKSARFCECFGNTDERHD